MGQYRTLTTVEIAALKSFSHHEGRRWKSTLSDVYWYNARIWRNPDDEWTQEGYVLHGLRNSHGPSWLANFKLPKD